MVLYISVNHRFHLRMGCGSGTNTMDELLALWGLLLVESMMGFPCLVDLGDSNEIFNWINKVDDLQVLALHHWCSCTLKLKDSFLGFDCHHIYRGHNSLPDGFSKDALCLLFGQLTFEEYLARNS